MQVIGSDWRKGSNSSWEKANSDLEKKRYKRSHFGFYFICGGYRFDRVVDILAEKQRKYQPRINDNEININSEVHVGIGVAPIQQETKFCYLGSMISLDTKTPIDIKRRKAIVKQALLKQYSLLTSTHFHTETECRQDLYMD
ncbi:hypothetical protein HHI36_008793 [Cryptolaemus montrouzieri]|uniref:Uncharacterized protein n=1 Tax=Cryptolaemus montrouzieri TaxID=559131 RepID=A0ABD2MTF7_9CUCU